MPTQLNGSLKGSNKNHSSETNLNSVSMQLKKELSTYDGKFEPKDNEELW